MAAAAKLHVTAGRLSPNGTALVTGRLPHGTQLPRSLVLSKDARYSSKDVQLGATVKRGRHGTFSAWLSLPGAAPHGKMRLLGCSRTKPSRRGCKVFGTLRVSAGTVLQVATPVLDTAHQATAVVPRAGGSLTATAADGATFTLTIPANDAPQTAVTLTPVSTLNPSGGIGTLSDGVMVEPIGQAPPGSTLTIHTASAPTAHARVIAFGGADPSEAAFLLPFKASATTTIALSTFGGYGIAQPPSGHASAARAASSRIACMGSARSAKARAASSVEPEISCITAAQTLNEWSLAATATHGNPQVLEEAATAILQAVEREVAPILSHPPTEEGAAELTQAVAVAMTVYRQYAAAEIGGAHVRTLVVGSLSQIFRYGEDLYEHLCTAPVSNSAVVYDYIVALADEQRQRTLLGLPEVSSGYVATIEKCAAKLHLKLSASDEVENQYITLGTGLVGNAKLHVSSAEIVTKATEGPLGPRYAVNGGNPKLEFDSASARLENPPSGTTASVTAKSGTLALEGAISLAGHERIRCANHKFVIEHFVYLFVVPFQLWDDSETVTVADAGVEVPYPYSLAADAWGQSFANKAPSPGATFQPIKPSEYVIVRMSPVSPEIPDNWLPQIGREATKAASGSCSRTVNFQGCSTYSFKAKFEGEALSG
jgi:hypothetical protein